MLPPEATRVSGVSCAASSAASPKAMGRKQRQIAKKQLNHFQESELLFNNNVPIIGLELLDKKKDTKWGISNPVGAMLASVDPIFSPDEEHMLLAFNNSIRVFTRATSFLVRILDTGDKSIAAFHCATKSPDEFYTSFTDGHIQHWNWVKGIKLRTWRLRCQIVASTSTVLEDFPDVETIFTADSSNGEYRITAHHFGSPEGPITKTLYRDDRPISFVNVLVNGNFLVAAGEKRIIIGHREMTKVSSIKSLKFNFQSFEVSHGVSCIGTRRSTQLVRGKEVGSLGLDVVVGLKNGSLQLYRDVLMERTSKQKIEFKSSTMHWHRNSVGSVKWSVDGTLLFYNCE